MLGCPIRWGVLFAILFTAVPLGSVTSAMAEKPGAESALLGLTSASCLGGVTVPRIPLSGRSVGTLLTLGGAALLSKSFEDAEATARALDSSRSFDGLADVGDRYGDGTILGGAALGLLAAGQLGGGGSLSDVGRDLSRSLLMTWGTVWALKLAINAERPNGGSYSFPSGHTATAFAAAPVFAKHWGWKAGIPAYVLAVGTGLGRMEERRHYLADVLFGAAIGIVMGREILRFSGEQEGDGVSISPGGVAVTVSF